MGQKAHPTGIRVTPIDSYLLFQKVICLFRGNLFYSFFNYSFINKSLFGEKLIQGIFIEKLILSYFNKIFCFVNKVSFIDTSLIFIVFIEFFYIKPITTFFYKYLFLLKCHIQSLLLDRKPIKLFLEDLNSKVLFRSDFFKHKDIFKISRKLKGADSLFEVGFLSNFWPCAKLFSIIFSFFFQTTLAHKSFFTFIEQLFFFLYNFKLTNFKGLRCEVRGRINFSDKSQSRVISCGSIPLQTYTSCFQDFGFSQCVTSYGILGVRVFFSYFFNAKNVKP
jgi:hypothetical protein